MIFILLINLKKVNYPINKNLYYKYKYLCPYINIIIKNYFIKLIYKILT